MKNNTGKFKKRTLIKELFKNKSKNAEVAGWVHNSRELGKIRFILLKDSSGLIQITAVREKVKEGIFDIMNKISRESVIYVKGSIVNSKQAPGGKEIVPEEIEVLNNAGDLPIDVPFNPNDESKTEPSRFNP